MKYQGKMGRNLLTGFSIVLTLFSTVIGLSQGNSHLLKYKRDTAQSKVYFKLGGLEFERRNLQEAIVAYSKAIGFDSSNVIALKEKGLAELAARRYAESVVDLSQAIRQLPSDTLLFIGRGEARRLLGDLSGSIEDFNVAIRLNGNSKEIFRGRALALYKKENYAESLPDFNRYLKAAPQDTLMLKYRGYASYKTEKFRESIDDYSLYFKDGGRDFYWYYVRGLCYVSLCDNQNYVLADSAIHDFKLYAPHNFKNFNVDFLIAMSYSFSNDSVPARQYFEKSLQKFPNDPQIFRIWGALENNVRNYRRSFELFQKAISLTSESPSKVDYFLLGVAKAGLSDTSGAMFYYDKVIALDSNFVEVYAALVKLFFTSNKYNSRVDSYLEKVIRKCENNQRIAVCFAIKGLICLRQKRFNDSEREIVNALKLAPDLAFLHSIHGLISERRNEKPAKAYADHELASTMDPGQTEILLLKALFYRRQKEIEKSCEIYTGISAATHRADLSIGSYLCRRNFKPTMDYDLQEVLYPYLKEAIVDFYFGKKGSY